MKTLIKIIAVAAAFGLSPASALAQDSAAVAPSDALVTQPQLAPVESPTATSAAAGTDAAAPAVSEERAAPVAGIGQPDGRMGLQDQFSPVGEQAAWFHDIVLMPVITAISILVLLLMLYVIVRFRRAANPTPSRTTHNTLIEVIWTLVPVIILVIIAVPSIRLLAHQYSPPKADVTVKAIGNQWYWSYQYPDNGDFEIVSNMLSDEEAKAKGEPRLLGVDERMVVPVGATVKLIVTSNDVLHSFALPAFWVKMDAVPGRLNETWFKTDRPGVYYGQCSELCGARHGYMPIAVEVVSKEQYAAWVASKGGTMPVQSAAAGGVEGPGAAPAASDAAPSASIATPEAAATPAPALVNATETAVPVQQAATSNPRVSE